MDAPIRTGHGPGGLPARHRRGRERHGHRHRLCARQRPAHGLHPGDQARGRLHARRDPPRARPRCPRCKRVVPEDVHDPATSSTSRATWRARSAGLVTEGAAGRAAHRPDGAAVPARLAQRVHRRHHHPDRAAGRRGVRCGRAGQTINIMTLGGLALAVGVLVDEATVEIENIHTHMARGLRARARRAGRLPQDRRAAAAGDALRPGGVRAVVLHGRRGPAAVRAAVAGRRLRDGRVLPAVEHAGAGALHLDDARRATAREETAGCAKALRQRCSAALLRLPLAAGRGATLLAAGALLWLLAPRLGTEIFPAVDAGQFQLRLRAPTGTRIERTELIALQGAGRDPATKSGRRTSRSPSASSACSRPAIRSTPSTCGPAARTKPCCRSRSSRTATLRGEALKERLRAAAGARRCPDVQFSFEAGRHRQPGDELRLADADRGRRAGAEPRRQPRAFAEKVRRGAGEAARRCATCSTRSRSTTRRVQRRRSTASAPGSSG